MALSGGREVRQMEQQISPAAIQALKEALTLVYWYKSDLRGFLYQCLSDSTLLSRLDWSGYKRNIVATLVGHLAKHQDVYQLELIQLMAAVCEVTDFSHLRKLDAGVSKAKAAKAAVLALRAQLAGHQEIEEEARRAERRRGDARARVMRINAVQKQLETLNGEFYKLIESDKLQQRGYSLERVIKGLFDLFDLDPKASFRIIGEQIDGAFSFEGTDYLLEARWQSEPVAAKELDSLAGKLSRKLENTLGLFLSVNGFSKGGIETHASGGRRLVILMDGSDLMAVLEGRIDLVRLLLRKRRHAAETGNIYLRVNDIL